MMNNKYYLNFNGAEDDKKIDLNSNGVEDDQKKQKTAKNLKSKRLLDFQKV